MSWVFCPHNDIYIWIWQINSVNSRDFGPGTWWDASSAFSLGSQIPKPKPKLLWQLFFRFLSYRSYCSSLPALGETFNSQLTTTAVEILLNSQACGPRKHQVLDSSPGYTLCFCSFWSTIHLLFNFLLLYLVINCYVYGAGKWAKHEFTVLLDWILFRSMQWNFSR